MKSFLEIFKTIDQTYKVENDPNRKYWSWKVDTELIKENLIWMKRLLS